MGFVSSLISLVRIRSSLCGLAVALALGLPGADAEAATLHPGDLIVTAPSGIFRVDPTTGAQSILSAGVFFPTGAALGPGGKLFVVDLGQLFFLGTGRVIRIDLASGAPTVVSFGGLLTVPFSIVVAPDGHLFLIDLDTLGPPPSPRVVRVDPGTGAQTLVSAGGNFNFPLGLAVAPTGDLYVADAGCCGGTGGVIHVDRVTGA